MKYRETLRIVDPTLRDGGLVNDFHFTDDFVRALYRANLAAGVDYMEVGYRASKKMFNPADFGPWKFSDDEKILATIGEPDPAIKLSVMADAGRCDFETDIRPRSESPVTLVRVATYLHQMSIALEMIEDAKSKGYEVSCNIMAISAVQEADLRNALDALAKSPVDTVYIVDSFGALYPDDTRRLMDVYLDTVGAACKGIGMHAHNNQQLAFANTILAAEAGADWLDATYDGMGRGAGNCPMEHLVGFIRNPKYKLRPVIDFAGLEMESLRAAGTVWGPSLAYLLTGQFNQHPRAAIAYTKAGRSDIDNFLNEVSNTN
ncbi:MAG: aldolase catalytic domain-containing protein [Kiritimatiellae bacterium]|nr:aldolase catalytic domain-containing protein [Kiritimatiellia bacterium]